MTCKWGEKKNMVVLLVVGLVLLIGGIVFNLVLPEDAHMLSRIAGFFSGMGSSFVAIALVVLLRRRLLGEARAKDSELAAAMMGINAVKAVEIGAGFEAARFRGEQNAEPMRPGTNQPVFLANNAGGIAGGISTGQPVVCRDGVKPTS